MCRRCARQTHSNLAIAYFDRECFQIHFGRPLGDLSGANVETGVMPWALHVEILERSFGQWAEAVCAKFRKGLKALSNFGNVNNWPSILNRQVFWLAKPVASGNGTKINMAVLFQGK